MRPVLAARASLAKTGISTPLDERVDLTMVEGLMPAVTLKSLKSVH
jgi:hypothetical protein